MVRGRPSDEGAREFPSRRGKESKVIITKVDRIVRFTVAIKFEEFSNTFSNTTFIMGEGEARLVISKRVGARWQSRAPRDDRIIAEDPRLPVSIVNFRRTIKNSVGWEFFGWRERGRRERGEKRKERNGHHPLPRPRLRCLRPRRRWLSAAEKPSPLELIFGIYRGELPFAAHRHVSQSARKQAEFTTGSHPRAPSTG